MKDDMAEQLQTQHMAKWRIEGRHGMTKEGKPVLRRSRRRRVIAGICGGLGEFFGLSPFWFRLAFLIALIPGGIPGLAAYLVLWIIVPNE